MIRTQIYLTKKERDELSAIAKVKGRPQSELIREAIDTFIESHQLAKRNKLEVLQAAHGMWADRKDLSDFNEIRKGLNRHLDNFDEE